METADVDHPSAIGAATSRPPTGYRIVRDWTLGSVRELRGFRAALVGELCDGAVERDPAHDSSAHDLVLVASELATNGLRHGIAPTNVKLLHRGDGYLLDVADHDLSSTPRIAGARAPGDGGFGLRIVQRVAVDAGWYRSEVTKHVWARFRACCTLTHS